MIKIPAFAGTFLGIILLAAMPRGPSFAEPVAGYESRRPKSEAELRYWLENMVWHYDFTVEEIAAATGLARSEIQSALVRFTISPQTRPARVKDAPLLMTPWPGGRAVSNMGNLDEKQKKIWGPRVEQTRQRETKAGIFAPWKDGGYVVLDAPEAIRSNLGMLYLAHVANVETLWTKRNIELEKLEWRWQPDASLDLTRKLPNGVSCHAHYTTFRNAIRMRLTLTNGSDSPLSGLWVQNCVFLKALRGFDSATLRHESSPPYNAQAATDGKRWVITAWVPGAKIWENPLNPCFHSDPIFEDCAPGQTRDVYGWLSFYEGTDIQGEFKRIGETGWQSDRWKDKPAWSDKSEQYR